MLDAIDDTENSFEKVKNAILITVIILITCVLLIIFYLLFKRKQRQEEEQFIVNAETGDRRAIGPNTLLKVLSSSKAIAKQDDKVRFSEICETLEQRKERTIREEKEAPFIGQSVISGISLTDPALVIVRSKEDKDSKSQPQVADLIKKAEKLEVTKKPEEEKSGKAEEEKEVVEKEKTDKEKSDKEKSDKEKSDKEKSDKAKPQVKKVLEKQKLKKEQADKEKLQVKKIAKEKFGKEKPEVKKVGEKQKLEKEQKKKENLQVKKVVKEKSEVKKEDQDKKAKPIDFRLKKVKYLPKLKDKPIFKAQSTKRYPLKKESEPSLSDISSLSTESASSTQSGKSVISVPDLRKPVLKLKLRNVPKFKKSFKGIKTKVIKLTKLKANSQHTSYEDPTDVSSLLSVAKESVILDDKLLKKDYHTATILADASEDERTLKLIKPVKKIKSGKLKVKTDPKIKSYIDDGDEAINSLLSHETSSFESSISAIDSLSEDMQSEALSKFAYKGKFTSKVKKK